MTRSATVEPARELSAHAIAEFRGGQRGPVIIPGEDGYDEARAVWNALIDRRPALVAYCSGTADVVHAVNFARD